MARQVFRVSPLRPGQEAAFSAELSRVLGQITDQLARLEGRDGHTPSLAADLNLAGNRVRNIGLPTAGDDAVTVRDARERALYETDEGIHIADKPIHAKRGILSMDDRTDHPNRVVTARRLEERVGDGQTSDHNARVLVRVAGVDIGTRRAINFLAGVSVATDDPAQEEVELTLSAATGASLIYEVPTGTIDGVNATFTLTAAPDGNAILLWKNGKFQMLGAGLDYTLVGNTITYLAGNLPAVGDSHYAAYETAATLLYEVPAGTVDGVNAIFTLTAIPSATNILLWKRGLFQIEDAAVDFTRVDDTITFNAGNLPGTGDALFAAYEP